MRAALVLAALCAAGALADTCTYRYSGTQCVREGLECTISTHGVVEKMCEDLSENFCYAVEGAGECKARQKMELVYGTTCYSSDDCYSDAGLNDRGVGLKCVKPNGLPEDDQAVSPGQCLMAFGMPGDYCTLPQECVTNQCGANNRCTGFAAGASCVTNPAGCGAGLYCNSQTWKCEKHLDIGAACDVTQPTRPCKKGSECSSSGKCVKYFTEPDGATFKTADVTTSYLLCDSVISTLQTAPDTAECTHLQSNLLGSECHFDDWISHPDPVRCACANDDTMRLDLKGSWMNVHQIKGFYDCLARSDCDRYSQPHRLGSCAYYKCYPWAQQMLCNDIRLSPVSYFQPNNCAKDVLQNLGDSCDADKVMPCKVPPGLPSHLCDDPNRQTGGGGGGSGDKGGEIAAGVIFGLILVGAVAGAMFWWNKKRSGATYGGVSYGAPAPTAPAEAGTAAGSSAYSTL